MDDSTKKEKGNVQSLIEVEDLQNMIKIGADAVRNGIIPQKKIDDTVKRILRFKGYDVTD